MNLTLQYCELETHLQLGKRRNKKIQNKKLCVYNLNPSPNILFVTIK